MAQMNMTAARIVRIRAGESFWSHPASSVAVLEKKMCIKRAIRDFMRAVHWEQINKLSCCVFQRVGSEGTRRRRKAQKTVGRGAFNLQGLRKARTRGTEGEKGNQGTFLLIVVHEAFFQQPEFAWTTTVMSRLSCLSLTQVTTQFIRI